jgi:hypothetical protein
MGASGRRGEGGGRREVSRRTERVYVSRLLARRLERSTTLMEEE